MSSNRMKVKKHWKSHWMTVGAVALLSMVLITGCSPAAPAAETPEAPGSGVTVVEPEPIPEPSSETEKRYQAILDDYLKEIPVEVTGQAAAETQQQTILKEMEGLYRNGADSGRIYTAYVAGITQLSPEIADRFTALAIAGMRRNSFEDYTALEPFMSKAGALDRFFKAAEPYQYHYVQLNRHTDAIEDPEIRGMVEAAMSQGYYIASAEGMLYYLVDFTAFARYRSYNTPEMARLIVTLAIDDLEPMMSDAALIVDREVLGARTWHIEKLLEDYKGTLYEQYLAVRYRDHMVMLFFGVNNTPNFSYETNRIDEAAVDFFKAVSQLENSYTAELVKGFMTILEGHNGILNDEARQEANGLLSGLEAKFGLNQDVIQRYGSWMSGYEVPGN